MERKAYLVLKDGAVYEGEAFGAAGAHYSPPSSSLPPGGGRKSSSPSMGEGRGEGDCCASVGIASPAAGGLAMTVQRRSSDL